MITLNTICMELEELLGDWEESMLPPSGTQSALNALVADLRVVIDETLSHHIGLEDSRI